jgi:hypothetical protein
VTTTRASRIRAELDHPVIDADGHFVELAPVLDDALLASLEAEGGSPLRDRYLASRVAPFDTSTVLAQRGDAASLGQWKAMPSWWGWQTRNTRDRATSHLPGLLYERLDEMGIDFSILYPSTTLGLIDMDDPELAAPVARAVNTWLAGLFRPYADRLTVGALIPMVTPEVAVAELCASPSSQLGFKTAVISGYAKRFLGSPSAIAPALSPRSLRSRQPLYDYDPVWATCVELGNGARVSQRAPAPPCLALAVELRVQPHRRAGHVPRVSGQVALPRWRHASLPGPERRDSSKVEWPGRPVCSPT